MANLPAVTHGSDFLRYEVATVQLPNGRWQAFVSITKAAGHTLSVPDGDDPFALPSMPTQEAAEEMACLLVWNRLDRIKVRTRGTWDWKEVDPLE